MKRSSPTNEESLSQKKKDTLSHIAKKGCSNEPNETKHNNNIGLTSSTTTPCEQAVAHAQLHEKSVTK